jgi:MYXO-CTERM domain-containing protein
MINVAGWEAPPDGGNGELEALPVPIVGGAPGDGGGDGDGDGDGEPGDGDGDPGDGDGDPGDGDGDPGDGDGDGDGSGDSGEDSSSGGESGDGSATTGLFGGGLPPGSGCGCTSQPVAPTPLALGLLALACVGGVGSRRRHSVEP